MKKIFFLAILVSLLVGSCKLFKKEPLGKSAKERKLDSIRRVDSIKKVEALEIKRQQEQEKAEAERKEKEERMRRVDAKYQIISGSFKVQHYADEYLEKMRGEGYDAIMIQGDFNFNLISIRGHEDFNAAVQDLRDLKGSNSEDIEHWIYIQK